MSPDELDDNSLRHFYEEAVNCGRLTLPEYNKIALLTSLDLLHNGILNNAAIAVFGKEMSIGLKLACYATDEKITFTDLKSLKHIFDGWNETLIYSCIQQVMGKIYVTDIDNPKSAFAYVGCFGFYAGEPEKELVVNKPDGFVIMTPQNEAWAKLIEECFGEAKRVTRYAIKKIRYSMRKY